MHAAGLKAPARSASSIPRPARRVRAADADAFVLDALRQFQLRTTHSGRSGLRCRVGGRQSARATSIGSGSGSRIRGRPLGAGPARLHRRRDVVPGDDEVRRQLAAQPASDDKLVLFDRYRAEVRSFAETVDAAAPEKVRALVAVLVDRVETVDRAVARVIWTPPARPFFLAAAAEAAERGVLGVAPPDGLAGSPPNNGAGLEWYAAS